MIVQDQRRSSVDQWIRTILLLAMLFNAANQSFLFRQVPPIHAASQGIQVSVGTDKGLYSIDETVRIIVTVSNHGSKNVTLQFGSSCQASFSVEDSYGAEWYDYSRKRVCAQVVTSFALASGQTHDFLFSWDQLGDSGVHVFAPANYLITGEVLVATWSGVQNPPPGQTVIGIQSRVAGDQSHPALVELLPSELVLFAPWTLLVGLTILYLALTVFGKRTAKPISQNATLKQSGSKRRRSGFDVSGISGWLSITGGSLTFLNGLFLANFGYLLSASYLSDTSYAGQIILLGLESSLVGLAVIACGPILSYRQTRHILLGATILTLSAFSSFSLFYFYDTLGSYPINAVTLWLGNIIATVGGILALTLKRRSLNSQSPVNDDVQRDPSL